MYSKLTTEDVRYVGKLEVAEAAKVIENVQRDINIALVNELARIFPALDVDVEDVLSAAANQVELPSLHAWCRRRRTLHSS